MGLKMDKIIAFETTRLGAVVCFVVNLALWGIIGWMIGVQA